VGETEMNRDGEFERLKGATESERLRGSEKETEREKKKIKKNKNYST